MPRISSEEESLLLTALQRGYHRSEFWRERLTGLGVSERDFVAGFPFADLPLISKRDILDDQAAEPPFGKLLAVDPNNIRRVHKTSGTSTTPFFIALTERDIQDTYIAAERAYRNAGMGEGDRIVHCLNFNMWSGGVSDYLPIERVGATGIPFGVGNTSLLLEVIKTVGANAISATPSYMFTIRDRCIRDFGIDPRELGLKRGYFGGEGLLQVPGVREEIEKTFGMIAMDANYGMSEVTSVIAGEGIERDGLDFHCYGILHAELIDAKGKSVLLEDGAKGELVFSSLRREAQPLFRYRTNDLVEVMNAPLGEDGLRRMRLRILGRSDEMLVIRGVNFFPQSLLSVIGELEPQISHNFRVERPKANTATLKVALETSVMGKEERAQLAAKFQDRVSALLQVRVEITWLNIGAIPQPGNKSQYLIEDVDQLIQVRSF